MTSAAPPRARILVVDDEPEFRGVLRRALMKDYDIHVAADAVDAEELLRRSSPPFDVVLCDLWMPGRTGPSLRDRLVDRAGRVPSFVFMSGALPNIVTDLLGEEPLQLEKPFSIAELRTVLARAVGADRGAR